jgi:NAD/NADP transhydrogenase beta subunit
VEAGDAGRDNGLFYMDKALMALGNAKKAIEDRGTSVE